MSKTMCRYFASVVIATVFLSGCDLPEVKHGTRIGLTDGDITTVEHDGHWFVVFYHGNGYGAAGGICHHPDCPKCKKIIQE